MPLKKVLPGFGLRTFKKVYDEEMEGVVGFVSMLCNFFRKADACLRTFFGGNKSYVVEILHFVFILYYKISKIIIF